MYFSPMRSSVRVRGCGNFTGTGAGWSATWPRPVRRQNRRPCPVRVRAPASIGGDTCEDSTRGPRPETPMTRSARPFRPAMEALETREVPATLVEVLNIAATTTNSTPVVERVGADLIITGTARDDSVTVSQVGR